MARDLRRDLLDRFAPAIAGEGVAVARVDDQRATLAALDLFAAELDFGRSADVAPEDTRDGRARRALDIGEVAGVPLAWKSVAQGKSVLVLVNGGGTRERNTKNKED